MSVFYIKISNLHQNYIFNILYEVDNMINEVDICGMNEKNSEKALL